MRRLFSAIYKNDKGMTLVEIIVSIAVIGILASMVLTVFGTGILLAVRSGDNTVVKGVASSVTENWLGNASLIQDGQTVRVASGAAIGVASFNVVTQQAITITLQNGTMKQLNVDIIRVNAKSDDNSTTISAFKPS